MLAFAVVSQCGCTADQMDGFFAQTQLDAKRLEETSAGERAEYQAVLVELHRIRASEEERVQMDAVVADNVAAIEVIRRAAADQHSSVGAAIADFGEVLADLAGLMAARFVGFPANTTVTEVIRATAVAGDKVLATEMGTIEDSTDAAFKRLAGDLRSKLEGVGAEWVAALRALEVSEAERRAAVFSELQLSDADKDALKSFSTEQILMMLGGLGLSGGGAVAVRRGFGNRAAGGPTT